MRRPTLPHLSPLAWVAVAAATTAALHFAAALQVRRPVYFPDEYRATAVARAFADGRWPDIRGGPVPSSFWSYVPSLLQAPVWWIDDVDIAYRLAQAEASIAFALAAFPAYALARRLGVREGGAALAALLALTHSAGAFSMTLMAEPYAFPLFLATVLLAVKALAAPTPARHLAAVAASVSLCVVGGIQFIYVAPVYALTWLVLRSDSRRTLLRRLGVLAALGAAAALVVAGAGFADVIESAVRHFDYDVAILPWFAANAFVLALGAGWVLLPAAILGLRGLWRSSDPAHRAFSLLSSALIAVMLLEAAMTSHTESGIHERYAFYGACLLGVAALWAGQELSPARPVVAALAYGAALAAIVFPIAGELRENNDHSTTLVGLEEIALDDRMGPLIWVSVLAALTVVVALRGFRHFRAFAVAAVCVSALTAVGSTMRFVHLTRSTDPPRTAAPSGSTMLAWSGSDRHLLQTALFWNPGVSRVAVLGGDRSPDDYAVVSARFAPDGRIVDETGAGLPPPYLLGPDALAVGAGPQPRDQFVLVRRTPKLLAFGIYRELDRAGSAGILVAAPGSGGATLRLRSPGAERTFGVLCQAGAERAVRVGDDVVRLAVPPGARSEEGCRFALTRGPLDDVDGYGVGVDATVELDDSGS